MRTDAALPAVEISGLIVKSIADLYTVEVGETHIECKARGVFRHEGETPLVGDTVRVRPDKSNRSVGVIVSVSERKNRLIRPPVANVDTLYIVAAAAEPKPNTLLIDRVAAFAADSGIEPRFVFNKTDLADVSELYRIYLSAGYKAFYVSCETGEGIQALCDSVRQGINAFTGNTGVGKSSVLNRIDPRFGIKTGEISEKLGRGRHTTRHTEMYRVPGGGYVIDTPGFSSFDGSGAEFIRKENLQFAFSELEPYIGRCKFTSCSHTGEKGCAVGDAVSSGKISKSRYESYLMLYKEFSAVKDWEIDRRAK